MSKTQKNSTIELIRFIMMLLIISIHAHIFKEESLILYDLIPMGIARIAVPFFLIVTGYFFYERIQIGRETKTYFLNLLKKWLIFSIIEVIIAGKYYYSTFNNIGKFIHRVIAVGLGDAYWYLWALPVSLVLLSKIWKKKIVWPGLVVGLLLFLFSMTNDSYSFLFVGTKIQELAMLHQKIFFWTGAGLLTTILFLSIGAFFARYKEKVNQFVTEKHFMVLVMMIFGIIAVMVESYLTMKNGCNDSMNKLSLLIATPFVFLFTLANPSNDEKFNYLGKLSFHMYLIHPIILDITKMLGFSSIVRYIITVLGSIVYSMIVTNKHKGSKLGEIKQSFSH